MGLPNNVKYSWNVVCNTEGVSEHRVVYPQIAIMGKPGSHMTHDTPFNVHLWPVIYGIYHLYMGLYELWIIKPLPIFDTRQEITTSELVGQ